MGGLGMDAAAAAAQIIPMLGLAVTALFAWLPRRIAKVFGSNGFGNSLVDALAVVLATAVFVAYAVSAIEASMICFDVLQGLQVRSDAAEYVRGSFQTGLVLLFGVPALACLVLPLARFAQKRLASGPS